MKYVIVYNDNEIVFDGEVPDNTITYYPDKGYYCKVFSSEEEKEKNKSVITEALVQKKLDVGCISCYREWLDNIGETYSATATKDDLKTQIETVTHTSNYPKDKGTWLETVDSVFKTSIDVDKIK